MAKVSGFATDPTLKNFSFGNSRIFKNGTGTVKIDELKLLELLSNFVFLLVGLSFSVSAYLSASVLTLSSSVVLLDSVHIQVYTRS